MKKTYLATLAKNTEITEALKKRLEREGIELLAHHKNLNVLKLASEKELRGMDLKPIEHIELDHEFSSIEKNKKL